MYDPEFLKTPQGPAKTKVSGQAPRAKGQLKMTGVKATH